jgi:hypothetical protein
MSGQKERRASQPTIGPPELDMICAWNRLPTGGRAGRAVHLLDFPDRPTGGRARYAMHPYFVYFAEKPLTFDTYKKADDLMNPMGRTLARRCRRSVSGAHIRCSAWFEFLCSLVYAKCIWPLQGKNRLLPCLLIAGLAIVPDDKLTIARGTSKADTRPATAEDVKSVLEAPATRAPRKNHREELQSSVERID